MTTAAQSAHAADLPDCVEIQTHRAPAASVIWLHGLGADGYDFVPVVKELEALGAPALRYVFPHAPMIPVTINDGFVMRAWYDIRTADLARREDEAGIRASQAAVQRLVEHEVGRGVPRARIVLAGFSQGAAIALQAGLRQAEPLAGLVALSGYLPLADSLAAERHAGSAAVPILMARTGGDREVPARTARLRPALSAPAAGRRTAVRRRRRRGSTVRPRRGPWPHRRLRAAGR